MCHSDCFDYSEIAFGCTNKMKIVTRRAKLYLLECDIHLDIDENSTCSDNIAKCFS